MYPGARPVFLDSTPDTWNIDPGLVAEELARPGRSAAGCRARRDRRRHVRPVRRLRRRCWTPATGTASSLIEDAAEALGADLPRPPGRLVRRDAGVLSFNGNKIITTGGGGMLVTDDDRVADAARYLATQAREPVAHYEHRRDRLQLPAEQPARRRRPRPARSGSTTWSPRRRGDAPVRATASGRPAGPRPSCRCADYGDAQLLAHRRPGRRRTSSARAATAIVEHLDARDIEARPTWKPMHLQPVFPDCVMRGGDGQRRTCSPGGCACRAAPR